ncbi:hypothetical protein ES15_1262 [Cronobacter sakazakii ES15]|uniref:Type II toxin-antitoxin system RelE/ParE family toxin n=3 Tax=Enterobacteriaceae TaxID=543 RepID=A7MHN9_CROS8|nr:hypothetical protein ESA_01016 [Cronobacter sakazakii ATCC BAA-894]AFJ98835.1 hypothetical protein ES15_1262 [Cronobacter sakazakii ES15]
MRLAAAFRNRLSIGRKSDGLLRIIRIYRIASLVKSYWRNQKSLTIRFRNMNVEQNGSELENEIEVFQTRRFEKALDKLPESLRAEVEDEVDRIIQEPEIGELKKGDLSFLRVHKFRLNNQLMLLGYCWVENKLELYMLSIGSHENFYQEQKQHRKADLKLIS